MRHVIRFAVIVLLSGISACFASTNDKQISLQQQRQIIEQISQLLTDKYVIPKNASVIIEDLNRASAAGVFSADLSTDKFIDLANGVLQQSHGDRHLKILSAEKYRQMRKMFYPSPTADDHAGRLGHHGDALDHKSNNHSAEPPIALSQSVNPLDVVGVDNVAEISRDGLNQIGYLSLNRFDGSERSKNFIKQVFQTFTESDGVIIDLRNCRGGDTEMVTELSNYFFNERTHLTSSTFGRSNNNVQQRWTTPNELSDSFVDVPLKILVSARTFSAAESFAFGIKSLNRAELIGEITGGGGYMVDFFPLPFDLGISVSVGRTYDPRNGKDWQGTGVIPDIQVAADRALNTALEKFTQSSGRLASIANEHLEIYHLMQNYSNAWYGADEQLMSQLLSDGFLGVYSNQAGVEINQLSKFDLVKETADGLGIPTDKIYANRIIRNIQITEQKATVTLILRKTVHQMTLIMHRGKWQIHGDSFIEKMRS